MKIYMGLLAACAAGALTASAAQADCAAELAALESGATSTPSAEGISKDGSLAPLQSATEQEAVPGQDPPAEPDSAPAAMAEAPSDATAGTDDGATSDAEGVAKDGSQAPLETDANQAMSGQDAQAQQEGKPTAAETAQAGAASGDRDAAIQKARDALAAGDEAACLEAVAEAAKL